MRKKIIFISFLALQIASCTKKSAEPPLRLDGSSTVFPISEAAAEEYQRQKLGRVTIGVSGTGGGFKQFCRGTLAITGASRPIKASEEALCKENNVNFVELPIALDGIAIIVNAKNTWLTNITLEELRKIWEPNAQGKITKWSQVRAGWPDKEIHLLAPGVDSGTYDYFTKEIVGVEHASRGDITSSEDDNVLVQGVATDEDAMGFVGFSYYFENREKLKLVSVENVLPSFETIQSGTYKPLSRPLFLYVQQKSLDQKNVTGFLEFYLSKLSHLVADTGFIPMRNEAYRLMKLRFDARTIGSLFGKTEASQNKSVESILSNANGTNRS
jgi:phosphate transport system substrate-binding protein